MSISYVIHTSPTYIILSEQFDYSMYQIILIFLMLFAVININDI